MDKFNFARDGITRLPPGFRFQPTDEELVFEYLKRKVLSWPLPASIIPEINVCKHDPWDLPGNMEQERYFFSNKETKYPNGNRINRATASGYWKATGVDKQIASSCRNHIVGLKKTLVFYRSKPPHGSRTDWIMHEYRLVSVGNLPCNVPQTKNSSLQNPLNQLENWVLCRVFLKKRSTTNADDNEIPQTFKDNKVKNVALAAAHQPRVFDFFSGDKVALLPAASSSSSSSSSSGITEVSSRKEDHEESTTSRNIL